MKKIKSNLPFSPKASANWKASLLFSIIVVVEQKRFSAKLILLAVFIIALVGGAYYLGTLHPTPNSSKIANSPTPSPFAKQYGALKGNSLPADENTKDNTPHPIGYIGCSNSADAVKGYHATPGKRLVWPAYAIGGASIDFWADPNSPYWNKFDAEVGLYGQPQQVWVQMCENYPHKQVSYQDVKSMLANLKIHAASATFYISPINTYVENKCRLLGPNGEGVTDSQNWAEQAVKDGLAKPGPNLGPLSSTQLQRDNCHPNQQGEQSLGKQLHDFFDNI